MDNNVYTLGKLVVEMMEKRKVVKVDALDVHELTPLADLFIIIVANNIKQTQLIADDIEEMIKDHLTMPVEKEGYRTANWILMDCGQVIIHILEQEHAAFYGLERLWKDAPKIHYELSNQ